jgi:hypothetical protein
MTFKFDNPSVVRQILSDLQQIEDGTLDMRAIIAEAPVLDGYKLVLGWSHALKGIVSGHPSLPDEREVVTSQLLYLDPTLGIARTMSRWYRVSNPLQRPGH